MLEAAGSNPVTLSIQGVAQLAEWRTWNPQAAGSSPASLTTFMQFLGVAFNGKARVCLGSRSCRFESCHPDQTTGHSSERKSTGVSVPLDVVGSNPTALTKQQGVALNGRARVCPDSRSCGFESCRPDHIHSREQ